MSYSANFQMQAPIPYTLAENSTSMIQKIVPGILMLVQVILGITCVVLFFTWGELTQPLFPRAFEARIAYGVIVLVFLNGSIIRLVSFLISLCNDKPIASQNIYDVVYNSFGFLELFLSSLIFLCLRPASQQVFNRYSIPYEEQLLGYKSMPVSPIIALVNGVLYLISAILAVISLRKN